MTRKDQAEMILTGRLFSELVESYKYMQYEAFVNADVDSAREYWAKSRAAKELHGYIENKCREIVDE